MRLPKLNNDTQEYGIFDTLEKKYLQSFIFEIYLVMGHMWSWCLYALINLVFRTNVNLIVWLHLYPHHHHHITLKPGTMTTCDKRPPSMFVSGECHLHLTLFSR